MNMQWKGIIGGYKNLFVVAEEEEAAMAIKVAAEGADVGSVTGVPQGKMMIGRSLD